VDQIISWKTRSGLQKREAKTVLADTSRLQFSSLFFRDFQLSVPVLKTERL